jgi:hypothetical protein
MLFTPFAGTTPNSGYIPVGSVIFLASAAAWSAPTSAQIKDGWALANGLAYPVGGNPLLTGNRPNLTDDRFLMGVSTIGLPGGQNSYSIASANVPSLSNVFTSTANNVTHTHTFAPALAAGGDHTHTYSTDTVTTGHLHTAAATTGQNVGISDAIYINHAHGVTGVLDNPGAGGSAKSGTSSTSLGSQPATGGIRQNHTHSDSIYGLTGVSADHTHSGTTGWMTANHTHTIPSVTSDTSTDAHTHTTTVTLGTASPTVIDNKPSYFKGIYLIAVGGQDLDLPLGSVLPVIDETRWSVPLSGQVKNSWIICDGNAYPTGSHPSFTGTRPQLNDDRFLCGSTATGAAGTNNSLTLLSTHIPTISGTFTSSANSVAHTHTVSSQATDPASTDHRHTVPASTGQYSGGNPSNHGHGAGGAATSGTVSADHSHNHKTYLLNPASGGHASTGSTPATGGTNKVTLGADAVNAHRHLFPDTTTGNADRDHTHIAKDTDGRSTVHTHTWPTFTTGPISQNHTHSTTVTFGSASPSPVDNRPKYLRVKFLMKVQ